MSVFSTVDNVDYARLAAAVKHGEATAEEHVAKYKEHGVPVDFWTLPILDGTPDNTVFFQQDPQLRFYQGQAGESRVRYQERLFALDAQERHLFSAHC